MTDAATHFEHIMSMATAAHEANYATARSKNIGTQRLTTETPPYSPAWCFVPVNKPPIL